MGGLSTKVSNQGDRSGDPGAEHGVAGAHSSGAIIGSLAGKRKAQLAIRGHRHWPPPSPECSRATQQPPRRNLGDGQVRRAGLPCAARAGRGRSQVSRHPLRETPPLGGCQVAGAADHAHAARAPATAVERRRHLVLRGAIVKRYSLAFGDFTHGDHLTIEDPRRRLAGVVQISPVVPPHQIQLITRAVLIQME